jgi:hypothetical protein
MYKLLQIVLFSFITYNCYATNNATIIVSGAILNSNPSLSVALNNDNIRSRNNSIVSNSVLLDSEKPIKIITIVIEEDVTTHPIISQPNIITPINSIL